MSNDNSIEARCWTPSDRERWMIAQAISGIIIAYDAPPCSEYGGQTAVDRSENYTSMVACHIANFCDMDHSAIAAMINVLQLALELCKDDAVGD